MPEVKPRRLRSLLGAFFIPLGIFLLVFLALCSYSGVWPPLAAIDSGSMQHSSNKSSLGVLDAGDIVLIRKVDSLSQINTYIDGLTNGSNSYKSFGDVVIYQEKEMTEPIIHRAICYLEYNTSGGGFDIPSLSKLPHALWSTTGGHSCWNQKGTLTLFEVGYSSVTVEINLSQILLKMLDKPHGGLITMGDANWVSTSEGKIGQYDQGWLPEVDTPIALESIIGVAKGELPWVGGLKVVISEGNLHSIPINSQVGMVSVFTLILAFPFIPEVGTLLKKRR